MNKQNIIQKVKALDGLTQDERAYLIDLVNTKKKYGLVWEDKPEDVEEQLRTMLPVLKEVREKRIIGADLPPPIKTNEAPGLFDDVFDDAEPIQDAPNHILIEGDNLHALTALSFTHEGKIDVIYIDPPYNTGNKDFKYNDTFVDKEDSYRHSKWLSMINKRLIIAKKLLNEKGVIFISIDENEIAELKLVCNNVFGSNNFIAQITLLCNPKGRSQDKYFNTSHEYCLIYSKTNLDPGFFSINKEDEDIKKDYKHEDVNGKYRLLELRNTHREFNRSNRPNLYYSIFVDPKTNKVSLDRNDRFNKEVTPVWNDGFEGCWTWGKDLFIKDNHLLIGQVKKDIWKIYRKSYSHSDDGEIVKKKLFTIWNDSSFFTERGQVTLGDIFPGFNKNDFPQPKAMEYIKQIVRCGTRSNSTILDFFAGSGTTLHATMALNAEDGGNRQCILVTNNENNICEEVTYERNKRVISGYTNAKDVYIDGLRNNNLRYFKTDFVPSHKSEENKRKITIASTDQLCIKEDCYTDLTEINGMNPKLCRIYTNDHHKYMIIVYHSRQQMQICEQLTEYIKTLHTLSEKVRLYAFSPEKETLTDEFAEVADKIEALPLPEAIYNAYRATFRAIRLDKKPPVTITTEPDSPETGPDLFTTTNES